MVWAPVTVSRRRRRAATRSEIAAFLHELGRRFQGSGSLYLVGGSTLVYLGYRPRTQDIDYRIELSSGDDGLFVGALRATLNPTIRSQRTVIRASA